MITRHEIWTCAKVLTPAYSVATNICDDDLCRALNTNSAKIPKKKDDTLDAIVRPLDYTLLSYWWGGVS